MRKTITIGGRQFKLKGAGVYQYGEYFLNIYRSDGLCSIVVGTSLTGACSCTLRVEAATEKVAIAKMNRLLAGGWVGEKWT